MYLSITEKTIITNLLLRFFTFFFPIHYFLKLLSLSFISAGPRQTPIVNPYCSRSSLT